MSETIKEKITSKGVNVVFSRDKEAEVYKVDAKSEVIKYGSLIPPNMEKPDLAPMKMLTGDGISVEVSRRRSVMPFWHRNMDFDEVIICVSGEATWKTEQGEYNLKAGELLYIPRGVGHNASAKPDSDYMAIEIKSRSELTNVTKQ